MNSLAVLGLMCMTVSTPNLCLKEGVRINGPHFYDEMVKITTVARDTAPPLDDGTVWITSANDHKHKDNSLHYKDRAFDIRIYNITGNVHEEAQAWADRIQEALGPDYDVIKEKDHIHVEFDPDESEDPFYELEDEHIGRY